MILPQHKEQVMLMRNGSSPLTAEPPTRKEIEIMRDHIVLSITLRVIEKKKIEVEMSSQTLKLLYSATTRLLAKNIREDVKKTKKILVEKILTYSKIQKMILHFIIVLFAAVMKMSLLLPKNLCELRSVGAAALTASKRGR